MARCGIERPVFFIGMPRSGTTVIFEAFAAHEEVAWLSNYVERFPRWPWVELTRAVVDNRVLHLRGKKNQRGDTGFLNRYRPKPKEAYPFWEIHCGSKFLWSFLEGVEATEKEGMAVRKAISRVMRCQLRRRFSTKLTGPPRIHYLRSIFPDALFVHVVRDGRAVVNSLLHVDFWREGHGFDRPWWRDAFTSAERLEWEQSGRSAVSLAALQWRRVIEVTEKERQELGLSEFMEIRYEDFIERPGKLLGDIFRFCGLPSSRRAEEYLQRRSNLMNMNYKYKEMGSDDLERMNSIMCDVLERKGYIYEE